MTEPTYTVGDVIYHYETQKTFLILSGEYTNQEAGLELWKDEIPEDFMEPDWWRDCYWTDYVSPCIVGIWHTFTPTQKAILAAGYMEEFINNIVTED